MEPIATNFNVQAVQETINVTKNTITQIMLQAIMSAGQEGLNFGQMVEKFIKMDVLTELSTVNENTRIIFTRIVNEMNAFLDTTVVGKVMNQMTSGDANVRALIISSFAWPVTKVMIDTLQTTEPNSLVNMEFWS